MLPIFLALIFGSISFIWAFEAKVVVTNAARSVARYVSIACNPSAPGYDPNWAANAQALGGNVLSDGALDLQPTMYPKSFTPGTQPPGTWYVGVQCPGDQNAVAYVEYNQTNLFPPLGVLISQTPNARFSPDVFTLQVSATYPTE